MASTVSLQPEPIPLDVKVVLLGPPLLYYLLSGADEDFKELFKIAADFDDRVERTPETTLLYARFIAGVVRREKLLPFDRGAVARVVERAARLTGDADRLSAGLREIVDLLQEADHLAVGAGKTTVTAAEVQQTIDAQFRRGDRIYRRLQEEIGRKTIRIETDGEVVGQVNGLSVMTLGGLSFGNPSRNTARVRLGRGEVVDNKSYRIRRDRAFIVAVNCSQAGGICFCVSMDAGPKVEAGFDLALTELIKEGHHLFVMELGSAAGADLVRDLPYRLATGVEIAAADRVVARTRDGAHPRNKRAQGIAAGQPKPPALGRGCGTLPDLRQLHECLSDLLLHHDR